MTLCVTEQDKKRLIQRLNRIEGQVRGLRGMIAEDRDCIEVLRQVASVSGALRGVWLQVVEDHMRGCIQQSFRDGHDSGLLVSELMEHLRKIS
jgi:DNA-binding FrmR family transcriptional regulator